MAYYPGQTEEEQAALDIEYYGEAEMSSEDCRKYHEQVFASGGYDVDYYPGFAIGLIRPVAVTDHEVEFCRPFANRALGDYNKKECGNFKFVELLKLNVQPSCGAKLYLTFKAKDADNERTETFQVLVLRGIPVGDSNELNDQIIECRIKPTTSGD